MASASARCSFDSTALLHSDSRSKSFKADFLGLPHHVKRDSLKCIICPSSMSTYPPKGFCRQVTALPDVGDFFWEKAPTPILDMVDSPIHLKNLSVEELKLLANEIRSEISFIMSRRRIPFKASLAVVELTVAIHHVFHAPMDKILWDIGEQTYAHKILTGRRSLMHTVKRKDGLSGFTSRAESEYDAFGAGHGCNSVSAGLGMAVSRDINGKKNCIVTVISNWTTMAGQVYEAMSNAGYLNSNMVVILNDSRHSLHPKPDEGPKMTINALSSTLSKLQSSKSFRKFREAAKGVTKRIGKGMHELAAKVDEYARVTSLDSTGPVLIHVITEDEKESEDIYTSKRTLEEQGTLKSNLSTTYPKCIGSSFSRTYNDCLVEALVAEAEKDKEIVVVHAGMGTDPSLQHFQSMFPERFFDVGMAEQHAVTFAAGLACGGLKPFCVIPSTFLQRAFDQVIQDVDLQKVPVRFAITSAGLVGSDGPTQCGAFDVTFMACLPNMIVMAPSNGDELVDMVVTAARIEDRPVCFRYPRGAVVGICRPLYRATPLEIGKGEVLVAGKDVAILGYGSMIPNCLKAQFLLAGIDVHVTVANARFCKPLDLELIRRLCKEHKFLITVEEGTIGGFGSHVSQFMALDGLLDGRTKWRPIILPDEHIEHASPKEQLEIAGLTGHHIAATALSLLGRHRDALLLMR
ncbi:probable 1-deoxy-D-xylulose-5-phosphate synthase, chloroplastic isoform X2 [Phoenix dactylifera]|uniref:1-deoxy-D-xylulose-5-phosphate synthase n=1 Tax=Phoenix dactylifera TaxID=42345 RepID=A0A8B8J5K2_PHODC|nr:probable 1-deoxy-D-xylulose-5-phosphate synthase, chloroplastic isoform X2 [Phoenix dactylifera]